MKKASIFAIICVVISFSLTSKGIQIHAKECLNELIAERMMSENQNNDLDENLYVSPQTNETITIREIANFLNQKKEHYPLSDEFIERYQQASGGYIDYAKELGLVVNKTLHEPNQKWHFMTSWLELSIEQGTLTWDADAKRRVYTGLLCPELLLWIYEACEVSPSKVRQAKEIAEQGKSSKTGVSTIAKNMRAIVSWEDVSFAILASRS